MSIQKIDSHDDLNWQSKFSRRSHIQAGISASEFSAQGVSGLSTIPFHFGMPSPDVFPLETFAETAFRAVWEQGHKALQYGGGEGVTQLIQWIINHARGRGFECTENEIIVTNGSSQALDLLSRVFFESGDQVWVEGPTYFGAIHIFTMNGAELKSFPIDEHGLITAAVEEELRQCRLNHKRMPKFLYINSNYQNPTGRTLQLERRKHLACLAQEYNFVIVEDDAYGELRFEDDIILSVKSFAPDHTIYVSTFSKIAAPGFRLGWAIASQVVIEKLQLVKSDGGASGFTQEVMAGFLSQIDYSAHLDHIQKFYKQRRDLMIDAIQQYVPLEMQWTKPDGGFYIWMTGPADFCADQLLTESARRGVSIVQGTSFYSNGGGTNEFRLCYSYCPADLMRVGIKRLGKVIGEMLENRKGEVN